jgi:copper(I)-binding protein
MEDRMKNLLPVLAMLGFLLLTSACAQPAEISIMEPWARPGFKGDNSAVYLEIDNPSDQGDGLIGAESDIAMVVEIHLSKMDAEGIMTMEEQELVGIPANQVVELTPGGLHIMLVDLVKDLNVGDIFQVTLQFQRLGDMVVDVEVRQP